jgi:HAD superfamily hydrolase (TIGR01450 family)
MGVDAMERELVTSGQATIRHLLAHHAGKSVFLLGNPTLAREFEEAGIRLEKSAPDLVVTAFDTTLTYENLRLVCDFLRGGLPYLATHPDYNCPTETGFMPDIGAIHAFIQASTGRMPDKIIGKPYGDIMDCAFEQTGHTAEDTAMVGDRLYTDIAVARHVPGLRSILVLTGETTLADLEGSETQPDMIFPALRDITPLL